ncbi:class I SAM-dependent methyltransferase [Candidatus Dependentiae bacterium]|nr:class I SAM-dependent methyltransferase [Candidatus Dependentiae bacterium]
MSKSLTRFFNFEYYAKKFSKLRKREYEKNYQKENLSGVPRSEISFEETEALSKLSNSISKKNMTIIEVGSWSGLGSTIVLGNVAKKNDGKLICIDTWKGNVGVEHHEKITETIDIFDFFLNTLKEHKLTDYIIPIRSNSLFFSNLLADGIADMVFIDGDHRYEPCKIDILNLKSKVKKGGILCGHDMEKKWSDLNYLVKGQNLEKILENDTFSNIHCGVSKAVYDIFGENVEIMKDTTIWYKTI